MIQRVKQPLSSLVNQTRQKEKESRASDNDFDTSLDILFQSFITWNRLQTDGIVTTQRRDDILNSDTWLSRYPNGFQLLHKGSKCTDSLLIGKGKYSKVYQRGSFAYKVVKLSHHRCLQIPTDKMNEQAAKKLQTQKHYALSNLRCNIKEMCFFHSMDHANVMKASRSQMIMEHGSLKKFIHEMTRARCTLQQMIRSHELLCFQDLVYMMRGVAEGLAYMHKFGIIHGDIKPSNILVSHRYESQISDFTLTTFRDKGTDMAFGTLYWRSPECLLQQEAREPNDVWAFGVILMDSLYGCNYMGDIMQARDNEHLLQALACLLVDPSPEFVRKRFVENAGWSPQRVEQLLTHTDEQLSFRISDAKVQITLSEEELGMVQDMISRILLWDPEERLTMAQVLEHPFFTSSRAVNPLPRNSEVLGFDAPIIWKQHRLERVWNVQWRDRSEREYIKNWSKFFFHQTYNKVMPPEDDWLLEDCIILVKRVIDRLKLLETTFDVNHIIRACCQFMFFMWKDYWSDDPLFECVVFHLLNLLRFNVFALNVKEEYIYDAQRKQPDASPKTQTQTQTQTQTHAHALGLPSEEHKVSSDPKTSHPSVNLWAIPDQTSSLSADAESKTLSNMTMLGTLEDEEENNSHPKVPTHFIRTESDTPSLTVTLPGGRVMTLE